MKTVIEQLVYAPATVALGHTILHSLWQATLLAALLWLISRQKRLGATVRYRLAFSTLWLQLIASAVTFSWYYYPISDEAFEVSELLLAYGSPQLIEKNTSLLLSADFWLSALVGVWFVAMLCGAVRLGISFGRGRGLRRKYRAAPPTELVTLARALAARIGYHGRIRVRVCNLVDGPALIGHLKPVLLFPLAVINQLSTDEAEAVILHELAHLQRQDHWWNLLQCLIEVLFYYHPAIHWIGARIRQEREHCCDDIVLRYGPDRLAYARALLHFEEQQNVPRTALALAKGGGLLARVQRFIYNQETQYEMKSRLFLLPLLALITLVGTAAYIPTDDDPEPETAETLKLPTPVISAPPAAPPIAASLDTLPPGSHQVTSIRDGKVTRLRVEDREIQELEIDGAVIPSVEYDQYEELAERMLGVKPYDSRQGYGGRDLDDYRDFEFHHFDGDEPFYFGNFDSMGLKLGEMGEEMGRMFESFGLEIGDMFSDGAMRDTIIPRRFRNGERVYTDEELLRELEAKDLEIEEMDEMIRQLERKKAEKLREKVRDKGSDGGMTFNGRVMRNYDSGDKLRELERELVTQQEATLAKVQRVQEEMQDRMLVEQKRMLEAQDEMTRQADRMNDEFINVFRRLQVEGLVDKGELKQIKKRKNKLIIDGKSYGPKVRQRLKELLAEKNITISGNFDYRFD